MKDNYVRIIQLDGAVYDVCLYASDDKEAGKTYVYCVFHGEFSEDYSLYAIFSTLEKAKEYALTWDESEQQFVFITEMEIDPE